MSETCCSPQGWTCHGSWGSGSSADLAIKHPSVQWNDAGFLVYQYRSDNDETAEHIIQYSPNGSKQWSGKRGGGNGQNGPPDGTAPWPKAICCGIDCDSKGDHGGNPSLTPAGNSIKAAFGNVYNIISASSKGDLDSAILHAAAIALTIQQVTTEIAVANALVAGQADTINNANTKIAQQKAIDQAAVTSAINAQASADASVVSNAVAAQKIAIATATTLQTRLDQCIDALKNQTRSDQEAINKALKDQ
ncbi:hypothetical protein FRB93_005539 [Tulasnella sp. JGI-2019a]|nr:hypothetical protein FRB93_005539 [Tulasnella sp. JGI-2019a]